MLSALRKVLFDFVVIAVISCIPLLWLPEGKILTGHDSGYPINVLEAYKNRFYTWNSQDSFGLDNTTSISVIPILSIQVLTSQLGLSVADSEKVVFVFWFFAMQAGMYALAYSLREAFPYRWFPLLASVLYVFNFYLLALWRYAAGTTFSAYTAFPLTLMVGFKLFLTNVSWIRLSILLSVILFVFNGGGGLSIPLFGGLLVGIFWLIAYFVWLEDSGKRRELLVRTAKFLAGTIGISLVLNAYWVLPFFYYVIVNYYSELSAKGGKAAVLMWTHSVSTYTSISNLLRLQGFPDWYNNPAHPYANFYLQKRLLIFASMLIAPIAYAALYFARMARQRKIILYFSGLSILGIFFAAGSHPPTGWLYSLFMLYVPGFVVFRSAQYKFIPALLLSFAILIAYTVNYIITDTPIFARMKPRVRSIVSIIAVFAVIGTVMLYHFPFFGRDFFYYNKYLSTLLSVPQHILSYDAWSQGNMDDEGRTLILPRFNSIWKAALYDWGYFSLYSPFNLITPKPFVQYSYFLNESQFALFNRLAREMPKKTVIAERLKMLFQVRHVLLAGDLSYKNADMPAESPEVYRAALTDNSLYPKVWSEGPWSVYSNKGYKKQKIYGVTGLTGVYGDGNDSIGAILWGSNNFIHRQIFGKSVTNPDFKSIPVTDIVYGIPCVSCILNREYREIVPKYTNVLPGSLVYRIKRLRERMPDERGASVQSKVANRLGLTMKRIAELATLTNNHSDITYIQGSVSELVSLWQDVLRMMPTEIVDRSTAELLLQVNDYAVSQDRILTKILLTGSYRSELSPLKELLSDYIGKVRSIRRSYDHTVTYELPDSGLNGNWYVDLSSLPIKKDGTVVIPMEVRIGDRRISTPANIYLNETVRWDIGQAETNPRERLTILLPPPENLISSVRKADVTIDGKKQSCQIGSISGFDRERRYKVAISNAIGFPEAAAIYVRKKIISDNSFSLDDTLIKADALNFDRYTSEAQDVMVSGSDGDEGMYLYLCAVAGLSDRAFTDQIAFYEVATPVVFVHTGVLPSTKDVPVRYRRIDQTKYEVDLTEAEFPMVLVFNENYNVMWRLSQEGSLAPVPSYAENTHMQVNGYANAWYLKEKPKGRLVVEFFPQSLFYKGIVITAVTVIAVLLYFVWMRKKV